MRLFALATPPVLVSLFFWAALVACLDGPSPDAPPSARIARIIVAWDPLACGAPHRVAIELEDDDGVPLSSSAPCGSGSLALDAPHFGIYLGRIYAWAAGQPIRSIMPVRIHVDDAIVRWVVATPG